MKNQFQETIARDNRAEDYEQWYLQKGFFFDYIEKQVILNTLNLNKNDIVLDCGCGTGRLTRLIAKKVKKVYAIDFSPKSIEVLKKKVLVEKIENIEMYVHDITKPFPIPETVDKIVSVQVIQHLPEEKIRKLALENIYNQLKENGLCVITLYNWRFLSHRSLMKEGTFPQGFYYYRFIPNEAKSFLLHGKFKNISIRGCINFRGYDKSILNSKIMKKIFFPIAE